MTKPFHIAQDLNLEASELVNVDKLRQLFDESLKENPDLNFQQRAITELLMAAVVGLSTYYSQPDGEGIVFEKVLEMSKQWMSRREDSTSEGAIELPKGIQPGVEISEHDMFVNTFFQLVLNGMSAKAGFACHSRALLIITHYGHHPKKGEVVGLAKVGGGDAMTFLNANVDMLSIMEKASVEDMEWLSRLDMEAVRERGDAEEIDAIIERASTFLPERKVQALSLHLRDECDCNGCQSRC